MTSPSPVKYSCFFVLAFIGTLLASCSLTDSSPDTILSSTSGAVTRPAASSLPLPPTLPKPQDPAAVLETVPKKYRNDPQFWSCASSTLQNCANSAVTQAALVAVDPLVCDDISMEWARTSCRTQIKTELAVKTKDLSACGKVEDPSYRSCVSDAARRLAMQTSDASWCLQIPAPVSNTAVSGAVLPSPYLPNERDMCLYAAASSASDSDRGAEICAKMENSTTSQTCARDIAQRKQASDAMKKTLEAPGILPPGENTTAPREPIRRPR